MHEAGSQQKINSIRNYKYFPLGVFHIAADPADARTFVAALKKGSLRFRSTAYQQNIPQPVAAEPQHCLDLPECKAMKFFLLTKSYTHETIVAS